MLVIISDTHLTDGTSGHTIDAKAFRIFVQRLRDLAYDASWRKRDDQERPAYVPIERIDLVLLGDILDVIRSTRWLEEDGVKCTVRPWDDSASPRFVEKVRSITREIIAANQESLRVVKSLKDGRTVSIPPADNQGGVKEVGWKPDSPGRVAVPVHLHYLVGNHDWFYHLAGEPYDGIRQMVADALCLDNRADIPFPHDPGESSSLLELFRRHAIFARHGDIYDSYNFDGNRDRASLGDAVVVELIDCFGFTVRKQFGKHLSRECLEGLREIDNLRPSFIIPVWLEGLFEHSVPDPALRRAIWQVWDQLVKDFFRLDFVRRHHRPLHLFDDVDRLRLGFGLSKGLFRGNMSHLLAWATARWPALSGRLFGGGEGPSYLDARNEEALKKGDARAVVYGHTHVYELIPLDQIISSSGPVDQIYINSGTWRPYHELAKVNPSAEHFTRYELITYVSFFRDDERNGKTYEVWNGVLGPSRN